MRVLWIATKVPVPPVDGGRLVQALTLKALAAVGAQVTLVAPLFPGEDREEAERELAGFVKPRLVSLAPRGPVTSLLASGLGGLPLSVARHARSALRREVEALTAERPFDVVHVEQLQALEQAVPAMRRGVAVVLRAQNVESDLWRLSAGLLRHPMRWLVRREGLRLARWEGAAMTRVARVVPLTALDASRLHRLSADHGSGAAPRVEVVPAPFPARLDNGELSLAGEPPVVVLGHDGWPPNRDAAGWMTREVWPVVRQRNPGAVLHLFGGREAVGGDETGVVRHPHLARSSVAFSPGAVLAVPLRVASGIRMKILEAWARGLAVVATPTAAAGLEAEDGRELLLAGDAEAFAAAIARLAADPGLAAALTERGRRLLERRHDPAAVARRLLEVYAEAAASRRWDDAGPAERRGMIGAP